MMKEIVRLLIVLPVALLGLVLALPVVLVALPFWLLGVAVRRLPQYWEPTPVSWSELLEFDPDIGWRPTPKVDAHYSVDWDDIYRVETDGEGWPDPQLTLEESDVVVFGDSYAFGFGIDPDDMFTHAHPQVRMKAVGAPGYNMVQELLLLQEMAERLRGKLVVWFVYPENDLPDNMRPAVARGRCPFLRRGEDTDDWEIVTEHLNPRPWRSSSYRDNTMNLARLCTPSPFSERQYSACRYLLAQGKRILDAAGADLAVLTLPFSMQLNAGGIQTLRSNVESDAQFDPHYPDKVISGICSDLQIPFYSASEVLAREDYKRFERYHWEKSGHQKVGRLIGDIHDRERVRHPQKDRQQGDPALRSSSARASVRGA